MYEIVLAYNISVTRTLRKDSLKITVIRGLYDQGVLTEEVNVVATPATPSDEKPSSLVTDRAKVTQPVATQKLGETNAHTQPRYDRVSPEMSSGLRLDARLK